MIYIDNIKVLSRNLRQYNEVWCIMRTRKYVRYGMFYVPELSPSLSLFNHYGYLKQIGRWDETTFKTDYLPAFLYELGKNDAAHNALNTLYLKDKQGLNIALGCCCEDESLCHRSIIAGLLQGAGVSVWLPSNKNYKKYYALYTGKAEAEDGEYAGVSQ